MDAYTQARMRASKHPSTHTPTRTRTHACARAHARTPTCMPPRSLSACSRALTRAHARPPARPPAHVGTPRHAAPRMHARARRIMHARVRSEDTGTGCVCDSYTHGQRTSCSPSSVMNREFLGPELSSSARRPELALLEADTVVTTSAEALAGTCLYTCLLTCLLPVSLLMPWGPGLDIT